MTASRRERARERLAVPPPAPVVVGDEDALATSGHSAHECTVHDGLRKLVQLIPQVTRGMRRRRLAPMELDDSGLGPRHRATLSLLREHGPMTVGRLAADLALTLPTVSGIVADVERAGFVDRSADPADRRRTIVALAPGRCEAVGAWLDGSSAPIARALGKLSPQERATFVKAMGYLEAELNGATGD